MENNFKIKNISFIMLLVGVLTSYSYGEIDLDSKIWKLAKTNEFCQAKNFKGMNINIFNEEGQTPLMVAAQHNNSSFIECMRQAQVDIFMKDHNGKTVFDYIKKPQSKREEVFSMRTYNALRQLEVYQIIGDKAQIVQENINLKKGIYKFWIEGAICEEFDIPQDIQCIVLEKKKRHGRSYDIYEHDVNRGVPPIFAAIQNHLYMKLFQILDGGANIEMKNKFDDPPLIFAIYQNDDNLVKILLEYGANPNVMDGDKFHGHYLYSALSKVAVTNRVETVKLLLQYGADVNYQQTKSETALTVAAKGCKNFELVKLLLDHGANPTLEDWFGQNTLTGLKGYCKDDKAYKKMKRFIEKNKLF
jgi:hypothetical protein